MIFFKGHTANIYCGHVTAYSDENDIMVVSSPTNRDLEWFCHLSCTDFVIVCPD
jgi:hypothetical protein